MSEKLSVGDLVYVVADKQLHALPNQTKGIIFSQIDTDWFRVYVTWREQTRVQDFPRHMLVKVV